MRWTLKGHTSDRIGIERFAAERSLTPKHIQSIVANGPGVMGDWIYTIWYWELEVQK